MALSKPPIDCPVSDPQSGRMLDRWKFWMLELFNRTGGISGNVAPADATYITQVADSTLTGEQALSTLTSGFMKVTSGSGVITSTGNTTIQTADIGNAQVTAVKLVNSGVFTGDVSGTFPATTVAKINGVTLGSTTATDKNILIADGTQWITRAVSGDATIGNTGTLTLANSGVTAASYGLHIATYDAKGRATSATTRTITGTSDQIDVSNGDGTGGNPTLTISASYAGQSSIVTTGTITSGTWNGTVITTTYGGTGLSSYTQGDLLYYNSSTVLSKLAKDTNSTRYLSNQGTSNNPSWNQVNLANGVTGTLPVANGGTAVTSLGNLTKVDDTNVTLTLGGTPTGALITSTSITAGWSGQLGLTRGGTNNSITADNGAIVYSDASKLTLLASTSTAGKALLSGSSTAPVWSTPTYPSSSGTSRKILVSDGTNNVYSTETWAVPSTSGKILQSDGTNWTSATPTGTGTPVLATSPTLVTPLLGTPTSGTLTNCTGLPEAGLTLADNTTANASTSAHGFLKKLDNNSSHFMDGQGNWSTPAGAGDALKADPLSQFASTTSLQLKGVISDETGSGALVFATSPTLVTPLLGTPTSGALTNCTSIPVNQATGTLAVANGGTGVTSIPSFSAYCSANTTLTANAYTKITFDSTEFNVGSMFDTTNKKFLPTVAGVYLFTASIYFSTSTTATSYAVLLYKNGALFRHFTFNQETLANQLILNGSSLISMNGSTDYIEVYGYNGNAITSATAYGSSDARYTTFCGTWVGPN